MILYIAAPLACASDCREWAETFRDNGLHVSSRWHDAISGIDARDPLDIDVRQSILADNLTDLRKAAAVFAVMRHGVPRATNAEIGYALALEKPVFWYSGPTALNDNIFNAHPLVRHTRSSSNALALVLEMARAMR